MLEVLLVEDNAADEGLALGSLNIRRIANSGVVARDGAAALGFLLS